MEAIRKMGEYEEYLRWHGFAERTIGSCAWVAAYFERTYRVISAKTLRTYRDFRRLEGYLRDGLLFLNRFGDPISKRGLACQLKARAAECGVDEGVVRPHAFRHLFARRFLGEGGDIALLADLMGHSSVETMRVYLRRTASEQRSGLERLICW